MNMLEPTTYDASGIRQAVATLERGLELGVRRCAIIVFLLL